VKLLPNEKDIKGTNADAFEPEELVFGTDFSPFPSSDPDLCVELESDCSDDGSESESESESSVDESSGSEEAHQLHTSLPVDFEDIDGLTFESANLFKHATNHRLSASVPTDFGDFDDSGLQDFSASAHEEDGEKVDVLHALQALGYMSPRKTKPKVSHRTRSNEVSSSGKKRKGVRKAKDSEEDKAKNPRKKQGSSRRSSRHHDSLTERDSERNPDKSKRKSSKSKATTSNGTEGRRATKPSSGGHRNSATSKSRRTKHDPF